MHNPCACRGPLVWDEAKGAYFHFFLSCNGMTKKNIWMLEASLIIEKINFKRKEKKWKNALEKEREEEEEECHENQQSAHNEGFCCHEHAKKMKKEREVKLVDKRSKKQKVNGPEHCIHCDEEPCCVFIQIELCLCLCENDEIYYDEGEYMKDPVAYNSER
jgi:hypothetical protein